MKRIFKYSGLTIVVLIAMLYLLSPFGNSDEIPWKSVGYTIRVKVSADSAFRYLSNSGSARSWSVFVHHITTTNAAEVPDGKPGSKRRCFCRKDETGTMWDETILHVIPDSLRVISIENLKEFPMQAPNLQTRQIYRRVDDSTCDITLCLYFINDKYSLWDGFKMRVGSFTIQRIFKGNLENIREILEGRKRVNAMEE